MTSSLRAPYLDPGWEQLLARAPSPRRALFLDRDGVINVDHGYVHTIAQTEWVGGIFDIVAAAQHAGYLVVVVTNQAGIGRGYYDEREFLSYTAWMHDQFKQRGFPLLATFWCPHHPEAGLGDYRTACACRKPKPGMLSAAITRFGIEPGLSLLIGDSRSDVEAAQAAGVRGELAAESNRRLDDRLLGCLIAARDAVPGKTS